MFVEWPSHPFVRRLEGIAFGLRKRLKLADLDQLDPWRLADTFPDVMMFDMRTALSGQADLCGVLTEHSSAWSALAYREKPGPWLVTWNPTHAEVRIRASIMEELAHIVLEHKPTRLDPDPLTGLPRRTYSPSKEKEAYGVAAASLLPYNGLYQLSRTGHDKSDIADHFKVSLQLVQYRMNVTRLAA